MTHDVNSHEYWNQRFRTDWDELGGPGQTEMFARIALRMLPQWLVSDIRANAASLLDAGCAEGEAVSLLRARFGSGCRVEGMDFSEEAVARARAKHGEDGFRRGDISALDSRHDVIFSSNTLEHFPSPQDLLEHWAQQAKDHVVLLIPFWEWNRESEHVSTFEHASLPATIGGRLVCTHLDVQNTARLPETRWNGHQALVVWSSIEAIARARLSIDGLASGLQPVSLLAEDVAAARPFGTTMGHAAALAEPSTQLQSERDHAERARSDLAGVVDRLESLHTGRTQDGERLAAIEHALASQPPAAQLHEQLLAKLDAGTRHAQDALQAQTLALDERILSIEAKLEAQSDARALEEERDTLRRQAAMHAIELDRLGNAERKLARELERERAKVAELLGSSSWRLTGPLRSVATRWYRLRRDPRLHAAAPISVGASANEPLAPVARKAVAAPLVAADPHRAALEEILARHAGQPVIVLRPVVDWDLPLFQRPQHIALRLARAGFLYFYCTPNSRDNVDGFRRIDDNLYLTDQFPLIEQAVAGKIVQLYSTDNHCPAEYVPERIAAGDRLLYEYIDEIHPTISGFDIPPHVMRKHAALIAHPDVLCVASADKLLEEMRNVRNGGTVMATNGVEHEHFHGRGRDNPPEAIADLVASGRPIIGYFGAFAVWFDYELVARLAVARPDCDILLLGWDYDGSLDRSGILQYPNVRVLGPIPYRELPDYARFFDVSTIPFLINDVTESTSPIKLFEYMALEHPIVTTNLPECRKYASVMIARDHGEFVALIDRALDLRGDASTIERLRRDAHANTWDSKASTIAEAIAAHWPDCSPARKPKEKAA